VFANIDALSDLGSAAAPLSNLGTKLPGSRIALEKTLGIARERSLPEFEDETLVEWYAERGPRVSEAEADRKAVLFPDTFTDHNNPGAGKAAIRVLEAANVHVRIPEGVTGSGRPPYSKGLIEKARTQADRNVTALAHYVNDGWDVVVVEPSDAVMFQLDYLDLLPGSTGRRSADQSNGQRPREDAVERLANNTYGVMEYLDRFRLDEELSFDGVGESLTYHGHCHQKATKKDHHAVGVLRRAGYRVDPLDSGCCGMAGSFGYEAEHYSMSQAIGSVLFGQIDESDGESVVAPGSSCRTQIGDEYDEKPPHPIRKLADALA
jgi:Fe-S oxidoreductase